MKVIIVQGRSGLGKSSLCKQLVDVLYNSTHLCVDTYKEKLWDKNGFRTVQERELLSSRAKDIFINDLSSIIDERKYDYIFLDYVFHNEFWDKLKRMLSSKDSITVKTLYLKTDDIEGHKYTWEKRSRDFTIRHPGHGASEYQSNVGSGYFNKFNDKLIKDRPTLGVTMNINIEFNPKYKIDKTIDEIVEFINI